MKLKFVILICIGCKAKETRTEIPVDQPLCSKCYMPMIVHEVKASSR
jgi:hypothetical protein